MKVSVLQENLTKALFLTLRFVSAKPQLPILSNVFLSAKEGRLKLCATNLETGITVWVGAKTEKEGATTVSARIITEVVSGLLPEKVEIETKEEGLFLTSGNFSFSFSTIGATEFPQVPENLPKEKISLPVAVFSRIARQVVFSASQDETKPVLSGVLFSPKDANLRVVATDGFRLSQKEEEVKSNIAKEIIVPAKVLGELAKIIPEGEDIGFWVSEKENQVLFGTDEFTLTTRVLEGEFPDYEKIIPQNPSTKVIFDKEELLQAIRIASIFAREAANTVKIEVKDEETKILAESPSAGQQTARLEAKKEGEDLTIVFNWRFLADFLSAVSGEEVIVEMSGPTAPALFRDPKDPSFMHLIMPIRIQG